MLSKFWKNFEKVMRMLYEKLLKILKVFVKFSKIFEKICIIVRNFVKFVEN